MDIKSLLIATWYEAIMPEEVVLGDMAVVTGGPDRMGTFIPGLIIGTHNMAIEADGRLVRKVGPGPGGVKRVAPQAGDHAGQGERSP